MVRGTGRLYYARFARAKEERCLGICPKGVSFRRLRLSSFRPAIERMISTPADSLKHAFDAVETMKLTYEVKKITLWELAMAMITIAMEKDILQGRS